MTIRPIRLRNFFFPTADLQPEGGFGDALHVPDDVGMTLAYPVVQTPSGARLLQGFSSGGLYVISNSAPYSDVDVQTATLAVGAQQTITPRFIPSVVFVAVLNAVCSLDITLKGISASPRIIAASSSTQYFALPITSITPKNQAASGTATCTVSFFV